MKKIAQFFLFLGLGVGIFYLVFQNQSAAFAKQCAVDGVAKADCNLVDKLLTDFGSVNLAWIAVVMLTFTLSNIFRAIRWQMQFKAMGHDTRFSIGFWSILLGYFANLGIPRMGEVVRAGTMSRYEDIPLEKSVGSMVIDRLADLACLMFFVGLTFLFEYDTLYDFIFAENSAADGETAVKTWKNYLPHIALGGSLAFGLLVFLCRKQLEQTAIFQKLKGMVKGFIDGIISIRNLDNPLKFSALSIGIWLMFYLQCLFTMWSFPPTAHLGGQAALMVFILGTLGFIIPTPGGMGSFHALAIAALALYGISGSDGFSYANIAFFSVQIFYNLVGGLLALFILPRLGKRLSN